MKKRLLDFINGKATFEIPECFPGEILRACEENDIALYDLQITAAKLEGSVSEEGLEKLDAVAEKKGVKLVVKNRTGLWQVIRLYRKRIGVLIGVLLFAVLLSYLSAVLWSVEIVGTDKVDPSSISGILKENGVETGVFLTAIHCNELERLLSSADERILKVTANILGCKLFIEVSERELPQIAEEKKDPCDIVAKKDGEIISADVFCGEKKISPGDAVVKGDVLIKGQIAAADGSVTDVCADGKIIARTVNRFSCFVAEQIKASKIVKKSDLFFPVFFALRHREKETASEYSVHCQSRYLKSFTTVFPIGYTRERKTYVEPGLIKLSKLQTMLICATDAALLNLQRMEDGAYVAKQLEYSYNKGASVDFVLIMEENIGIRRLKEEKIEKTPD